MKGIYGLEKKVSELIKKIEETVKEVEKDYHNPNYNAQNQCKEVYKKTK